MTSISQKPISSLPYYPHLPINHSPNPQANLPYQTVWDATNQDLTPPPPLTTCQKILFVAKVLFCIFIPIIGIIKLLDYLMYRYCKHLLLPVMNRFSSPSYLQQVQQQFINFWNGPKQISSQDDIMHQTICDTFIKENHTVITPDGSSLRVILLRHKDAFDIKTPTIIYFNPNLAISLEGVVWPLKASIETKTPCNFVFFDYRGVADSTGSFEEAQNLILDGTSIVQWVHNYLKTPPENIHFYGFSLGGAIATLTKARGVVSHSSENSEIKDGTIETPTMQHKKLTGPLLVDRSFRSLSALCDEHYGPIGGTLFKMYLKHHNFILNPEDVLPSIEGRKLALYHKKDWVIPKSASFAKTPTLTNKEIYPLRPIVECGTTLPPDYLHSAPLILYSGAIEHCKKFFFPSTASIA